MNKTLVLLAFALLITLVQSQRGESCSGRGVEVKGKCVCVNGFYGSDCGLSVASEAKVAFVMYRTGILFFYTVVLVLAFLIYLTDRRKRNESATSDVAFSWAKKFLLIWIMIMAVQTIVHFAVDPLGSSYILPFIPLRLIFFAFPFPALVVLLSVVLLHWASTCNVAGRMLQKAEALSKINSNYNPTITLEDVMSQIRFLDKAKIPYLIACILAFAYQIIRESLLSTRTLSTAHPFIQPVWLVFYNVIYISYAIGLWYYGSKLVNTMPDGFKKRTQRITLKLKIVTMLFVVSWMACTIVFSIRGPSYYYFLFGDFIFRFTQMILMFTVLTIFMRFRGSFPFVELSFKTSEKSNSGSTKTGSQQMTDFVDSIPAESSEV